MLHVHRQFLLVGGLVVRITNVKSFPRKSSHDLSKKGEHSGASEVYMAFVSTRCIFQLRCVRPSCSNYFSRSRGENSIITFQNGVPLTPKRWEYNVIFWLQTCVNSQFLRVVGQMSAFRLVCSTDGGRSSFRKYHFLGVVSARKGTLSSNAPSSSLTRMNTRLGKWPVSPLSTLTVFPSLIRLAWRASPTYIGLHFVFCLVNDEWCQGLLVFILHFTWKTFQKW